MPETSPSSPPPSEAPPPPAAAASPAIVQAFAGVLTRPARFFASLRGQAGVGAPVVFALAMGLASGIVTAVLSAAGMAGAAAGGGATALVLSPVRALVGCFVGGAIVHAVAALANGKGAYEQSVRVAGYASAVMPIAAVLAAAAVPLGALAQLYGVYLVAQGVTTLHLAERRRTFAAAAALGALVLLLGVAGHLAGGAGQDAADARFGPGSDFQREMQRAEEELRRAADEARVRQEGGR